MGIACINSDGNEGIIGFNPLPLDLNLALTISISLLIYLYTHHVQPPLLSTALFHPFLSSDFCVGIT
jgi:hypothetical protein